MSRFYIPAYKGKKQVPSFAGVKSIGSNALQYMFQKRTDLSGGINFQDLVSVNTYGLNNTFYMSSGITSVSFSKLKTIARNGLDCFLYGCGTLTGAVTFSELTNIEYAGMTRAFYNCSGITSVSFPKLETLLGNGLSQAFYNNSGITSISFPKLTTIGTSGLNDTFYNCNKITSVSFPSLNVLGSSNAYGEFQRSFANCTSLSSVYFSALKSCSQNSHFQNMLWGVTGCTVHFPSNMQSVIGSHTDITNGFGGTNTTVLFDLPATS